MLSSTALRYFAEVARCGSLRVAAERLFVAGSAVSRQLGLLEEEFGTPLFERGRGKKSMRLTPAGDILMRLVQNMEMEEKHARSAVQALKHPERQVIRMGMPESITRDFIPTFLTEFRQRHPDVNFQVQLATSTRLIDLVKDDQLDLALVFNALMVSGIKAVYERELATCVVVEQTHPLAEKDEVSLEDCAGYPMALPDASLDLLRVHEETFGRAGVRSEPVLVSNSYELLRSACAAGMAVAVLSEPLSRQASDVRTLRYVPVRNARSRTFGVFVRQEGLLPAMVQEFVADLVTMLRDLEQEQAPVANAAKKKKPATSARPKKSSA